MRQERYFTVLLALSGVWCLLWGCAPDDKDRCDDDQIYQGGYCEAAPDQDSEVENPYEDSGVTGLGEPCSSQDECADLEADYCAMQPGANSGNCAVSNCSTVDDQCPLDLICCDFPSSGITEGVPDLCIPPADWDTYDGLGMCNGD